MAGSIVFNNAKECKSSSHAKKINILDSNVVGIYLLRGNNGKTKPMCKICSNLTAKTPDRHQ